MAIVGIGVDIVRTGRIRGEDAAAGEGALLRPFLTDREWDAVRVERHPERAIAAVMATKEAFLKAVGAGLAAGVPLQDIEVRISAGRAVVACTGPAAAALAGCGGAQVHATIAAAGGHVIATVMVTGGTSGDWTAT